MKSFHRTMGTMAGIFLLMIIVSVALATSYINHNNLTSSELWHQSTQLEYSDEWNFGGILNANNKSSTFPTESFTQSDTFGLQSELFISSSTENIVFVEEERDDIQVDFYRSYPNTSAYKVTYDANESNDQISISSTLKIRGLSIDKNYEGTITVYVPKGYRFERITLESGAASIDSDNIYSNTAQLNIIADFGDIEITIDESIGDVNVECNMGSINLNIEASIHYLEVQCDMGSVELNINDTIDTLVINNDMGDTDITATADIDYIELESNMGKITGEFYDEINGMKAIADMGSIILHFHENEDMVISIDTDMGSIHSDFPVTEGNSDFFFGSDMGSIDIYEN